MPRLCVVAILAVTALGAAGCRLRATSANAAPTAPATQLVSRVSAASALFTDVTATAKITFRHDTGGRSPLNILQTIGSGCAFFDYNNDGWLDLYLVNSHGSSALYRSNRDGTFTDVTAKSGVANRGGYGVGCAVGDYNGDGWLDLYVTNYGSSVLYRNNGNGTFRDVTRKAGVAAPGWRTSAAFGDYDGDGWLDLYVAGYAFFHEGMQQLCPVRDSRNVYHDEVLGACSPIDLLGEPGILYRNNGDGTFTDVTTAAGVANEGGKGLGVVWFDYDLDGKLDLFVANDVRADNLYRNVGHGKFRDVALEVGAAYNETGAVEASMGVDVGDYDNDGRLDLVHTNWETEGIHLLHREPQVGFTSAADRAGALAPTRPFLGFGIGFLDYDNDGWLDLVLANGHVVDTVGQADPTLAFAQSRLLLRNQGQGRFEDVTASAAGEAMTAPAVGRGVAFGDYDNDGDADVLVSNNGGPAMLLRNNTGNRQRWLRLRLEGRAPNRFAIGARVTVVAGDLRQVREVRAGRSYASTSDFRLHFGLGTRRSVDRVILRWPRGRQTVLRNLPTNREITVRE